MIKELNKNHLLELAKFGGIFFYFSIGILVWAINPMDERQIKDVLSIRIISSVAGYISISLLYFFFNYQFKKNILSKKIFTILLLPGSYLTAVLWMILHNNFYKLLHSESLFFNPLFFIKGFSFLFLVIAFAGIYFLINYWASLKKQKEMTLQATNLANEAQLQMLRYQINPHFLFNALNTIRSMVEEDKNVARNMITELSNFFRYSLTQNGTTDTFGE